MEAIKKNELKILYEISMSIGSSLDIRKMLKLFVSTILRKLSCSVGVVFARNDDGVLLNIYSSPKMIVKSPIYRKIINAVNKFEKDGIEDYSIVEFDSDTYCHMYRLPDVGVFVLIKNSSLKTTQSLIPIFSKLSTSIQSCYNYDKMKEQQTILSFSLEKANAAQKAKDMFLATMSHEIRTPLNGIIGFLSLLKDTVLTSQQADYVDTIDGSSKSLLHIIDDILDFSKISASKLKLERHPFNCKKEVRNLAKQFRYQIESKGIEFVVDIDDNLPECLICDKNRMRQVMTNLLGNALKFTSNGEIRLTIKVISKTANNVTLRYSVRDTGIGIPAHKQETIFESFSQADTSTTRKFGGTGLGLSIVKGIVNLAGGDIVLKSMEGFGSEFCFTLTLDICDKDKAINTDENETKEYHFKGSKILVAEDNSVNQMLIKNLLENRDIEIVMASDGKEAVDIYKKDYNDFDLIFMDISMPVLGGVEATKEIIKYEKDNNIKHTPVIAITANVLADDRTKYVDAGMDGYIAKPIDTQLLDKKLLEFISSSEVKQQSKVQLNSSDTVDDSGSVNYDVSSVASELSVDEELLKSLLKTFFQNFNEQIVEIYQAYGDGDFETLEALLHNIKGSSGSLRIKEVFKLTSKLNSDVKNRNKDIDYKVLFSQLEELIKEYKDILKEVL